MWAMGLASLSIYSGRCMALNSAVALKDCVNHLIWQRFSKLNPLRSWFINQVLHPAEGERLHELLVEEIVWESHFNLANFFQLCQVL
jgi:hypothetical protein